MRLLYFLTPALLVCLLFPAAKAAVEYDSNQLLMMSSDKVSDLVRKKIKKAQEIQKKQVASDEIFAEPETAEALKDGLFIILGRPDQDGERGNAFASLRHELVDLDIFEKSLSQIATEAIVNIRSESTPSKRVATYVIILENLMAEIKPEVKDNAALKKIVEEIRDANLKISSKVKNEVKINSMTKLVSPSETAAAIVPKPKK